MKQIFKPSFVLTLLLLASGGLLLGGCEGGIMGFGDNGYNEDIGYDSDELGYEYDEFGYDYDQFGYNRDELGFEYNEYGP